MHPLPETTHDYSVLVPCFNASTTLERALLSALAQSVPPAEIIVVDDGSSDTAASKAIARRHAPTVRFVEQDNRGPGAARNAAARLASSRWLAFLDADDAWLADKMARQLRLVAGPETGLLLDSPTKNGRPAPATPGFDDLWQLNWVRTSAAVVRREAFASVGGFEEDRALIGAEDYNLWLRLLAAGWTAAADSASLIHYTPAANSITRQIERCARGELDNIDRLHAQLGMDAARVCRKRRTIQLAFGRDLLHHRNLRAARAMLGAPARHGMPEALLFWLATFAPTGLLDLHRKLRARRRQPSRT